MQYQADGSQTRSGELLSLLPAEGGRLAVWRSYVWRWAEHVRLSRKASGSSESTLSAKQHHVTAFRPNLRPHHKLQGPRATPYQHD